MSSTIAVADQRKMGHRRYVPRREIMSAKRSTRSKGCLKEIALSLALLLPAPIAAQELPEAETDRVGADLREILFGSASQTLVCSGCPVEPPLRVNTATGFATEVPLPYSQVNDLALFPDRRRVLLTTSSKNGKQSLLLVLSSESLAPLGRVQIPGNGRRLLVSPDGYFAYVLVQQPEKGRAGEEKTSGRWELLGVDLGASTVSGTYPLGAPASTLALAPGGERVFVALQDRIQSFTTRPLTASWYFRSPGDNREMAVRPFTGELFVLRGSSVAIFDPGLQGRHGEESDDKKDDAALILTAPTHIDRIAFSANGRLAVASGKGLDELLVLDAEKHRVAGSWPEDSTAIAALLNTVAIAEKPHGPRGKLSPPRPGFSPPLVTRLPPAPPSKRDLPGVLQSGSTSGDARAQSSPPSVDSTLSPPPFPQKEIERVEAPGPGSPPEIFSLEEVGDRVLAGRLGGDISQVTAVILYGPDSITTVRDRVTPSADGSYSFKLPPRGRYRIVPSGAPHVALSCRPAFHTLDVGEYGFRGIDFKVLGAVVGLAGEPGLGKE